MPLPLILGAGAIAIHAIKHGHRHVTKHAARHSANLASLAMNQVAQHGHKHVTKHAAKHTTNIANAAVKQIAKTAVNNPLETIEKVKTAVEVYDAAKELVGLNENLGAEKVQKKK